MDFYFEKRHTLVLFLFGTGRDDLFEDFYFAEAIFDLFLEPTFQRESESSTDRLRLRHTHTTDPIVAYLERTEHA